MATGVRLALSGVAKVHCVHDREKRLVTDPEDVRTLGESLGVVYDARKHKIHTCACCENLFVTGDDTPRLCDPCMGLNIHPLGGTLPEPRGVIA
jgi:hypothetical protein